MRDLMEKFGWDVPYIPMNVKNSEGKLEDLLKDPHYIAELKRDGSRYVSIDGRLFSRKKSENKKKPETLGLPVEKTPNAPHIVDFLSRFPGTVVEGEMYYPKKKSNTVTGIMGSDEWKALSRQGLGDFRVDEATPGALYWRKDTSEEWIDVAKKDKDRHKFEGLGPIHYMIFEMTYLNGRDLRGLPWHERREILEDWYDMYVADTPYSRLIHLSTVFETEHGKRAILTWAENNGEEGIVLKNRYSTYHCDKRPEHHWYRVKGKITADVVVTGYKEPTREYSGKEISAWPYWVAIEADGSEVPFEAEGEDDAHMQALESRWPMIQAVTRPYFYGWIASVTFGLYKDGQLIEVGSCDGINDETIQLLTDNKDTMVGRVIEITAMERTDKGKFRHPQFERFRDDKNAEDCLFDEE